MMETEEHKPVYGSVITTYFSPIYLSQYLAIEIVVCFDPYPWVRLPTLNLRLFWLVLVSSFGFSGVLVLGLGLGCSLFIRIYLGLPVWCLLIVTLLVSLPI